MLRDLSPSPLLSLRHELETRLRDALLRPVGTARLDPERLFPEPSLALYVHIPFCGSTCSYCSFNKYRRPVSRIEAYLSALERESELYASRTELARSRVSSVYIGGGTPSYVPAELLEQLLTRLRRRFRIDDAVQITMEANPESIAPDKLACYLRAGINRISLGVQSFNERQLRRLGRHHGNAQIRLALRQIREAGIEEINVDLMYGLPEQTLAEFATDLRHAISTRATHVALFPLSYQPGTALWRLPRRRRPLRRMYEHAIEVLGRAGFRQYTTEDFTRTVPCAYNVDLWQPPPSDCLGLGAGSLSSVGGTNWHNIGRLDAYVRAAQAGRLPIAGGGQVSTRQQMIGHLHLATKTLRLDRRAFRDRFGVDVDAAFGPTTALVRALGLARRCPGGDLELTARGRYLASRMWSAFILGKLAVVAADGGPDR